MEFVLPQEIEFPLIQIESIPMIDVCLGVYAKDVKVCLVHWCVTTLRPRRTKTEFEIRHRYWCVFRDGQQISILVKKFPILPERRGFDFDAEPVRMDMITVAKFKPSFVVERQAEQHTNHPFCEPALCIVFAEIGETPAPEVRHAYVSGKIVKAVKGVVEFWNSIAHGLWFALYNVAPQPPQPYRYLSGSVRTARGPRSGWRRFVRPHVSSVTNSNSGLSPVYSRRA
jgi:hypothetical protein